MRIAVVFVAAFCSVVMVTALGVMLGAQSPTFDVASIKRHVGSDPTAALSTPGQLRVTNVRVAQIVTLAWEAPMGLKGLPKWTSEEAIDLEAKWPAGTPPAQVTEMWRALFAERMKLEAHHELVDDPSFALTLARPDGRLGKGLTRSTLDCDAVAAETRAGRRRPDLPNGAPPCRMWNDNNTILAGGITMAGLVPLLTQIAGRQVVDRTWLDGRWEFVLHYSREERDPNAPLGLYPSIFSTLQSELGLKLVAFVGKNKLLVIDHIERPTEN